jgi:hypothetical protein
MPAKTNPLEKHKRYKDKYKPNDLYWGLGIERECYLETKGDPVTGQFFKNQKPERYSVDYYKSYKPNKFNEALRAIIDPSENYNLPILINAHSFLKTDALGEPATLYRKNSPPNPKYSGKSLFESLKEVSTFFSKECENSFTFDGDTIEIMTQNFYKTTVKSVVNELNELRDIFIRELNKALTQIRSKQEVLPILKNDIKWMSKNYGIVRMLTNLNNIAIFNNGTYHINITLPTETDGSGNIKDMPSFVNKHRKVINYYQWLEPILLGAYGTGDILAESGKEGFAKGSLRNSLSRYIGVGTYDTRKMNTGKILTVDRKDIDEPKWMEDFNEISVYESLPNVGLDFNFNKHHNHGIEFRMFDWFPEDKLEALLITLVHSADAALEVEPESPIKNHLWNYFVEKILLEGHQFQASGLEWSALFANIKLPNKLFNKKTMYSVKEVWGILSTYINKHYHGDCTKYMIWMHNSAKDVDEVLFNKCFLKFKSV